MTIGIVQISFSFQGTTLASLRLCYLCRILALTKNLAALKIHGSEDSDSLYISV